jgi:hypothetical protein
MFRLVTTFHATWRYWKTGNKRCEGGITEGNEHVNEGTQAEIIEI